VALNVRLEFRDTAHPELTDHVNIIRVEVWQEISESWSVMLQLRSKEQKADLHTVLGEIVKVHFNRDEDGKEGEAEPFLPFLEGMISRARQLSVADGKSTYELVIVHQLWLFTLRKTCGVLLSHSAPEILKRKVDNRNRDNKVKIPPMKLPAEATRVREYTAQYAEGDYEFVRRVLAEDGVAFFFTGQGLTTLTMVSDTSATSSDVQAKLPYAPTADALHGDTDAVIAVEFGEMVAPTDKMLRDYHFDNPRFRPTAKAAGSDFDKHWGDYTYEEGSLHAFDKGADENKLLDQSAGEAVAKRRVEALTKDGWTAECRTTCPLPAGAVVTISGDHPIADIPLLVVRAITILEYPQEARESQVVQIHRISCVQQKRPYRPRLIPKPRIHGIQRATVIGQEHIDVDEHGRVLLAFNWELATDPVTDPENAEFTFTRRVQVVHGWAGPSHGFVVLPRCGDEVLVAYVDGDPDEPVVVGRVYNGINRGEVKLPDDKTQSLWRTQSSPSKDGFHEIRFEDRSGQEELHIEAQRLHTRLVKGSEQVNVNGSRDISVGGTETEQIHKEHFRTVDENEYIHVKGDRSLKVDGSQTDEIGSYWMSQVDAGIARFAAGHYIEAGSTTVITSKDRKEETTGTHKIEAGVIHIKARGMLTLEAPVIKINGVIIEMKAGLINETADGMLMLNGGIVKIN
jgi:type VI secretion system secreted protein VgrG